MQATAQQRDSGRSSSSSTDRSYRYRGRDFTVDEPWPDLTLDGRGSTTTTSTSSEDELPAYEPPADESESGGSASRPGGGFRPNLALDPAFMRERDFAREILFRDATQPALPYKRVAREMLVPRHLSASVPSVAPPDHVSRSPHRRHSADRAAEHQQKNSEEETEPKNAAWWRRRTAEAARRWLYRTTHSYFAVHLGAWIVGSLVLSGFFYLAVRDRGVSYVDALFTVVSSVTGTGLAIIKVTEMSLGAQIFIFFMVLVGGSVAESMIPLWYRNWKNRREPTMDVRVLLERAAVWYLTWITLAYYVLAQLLVALSLGMYFQLNATGAATLRAANNANAWFFGFFESTVVFQGCGYSLLPSGGYAEISEQAAPLLMLIASTMLGNVAYPILLRGVVHVLLVISRRRARAKGAPSTTVAIYEFLLEHPRQCLTHLFPGTETRVLLLLLVCQVVGQSLLMMGTDWNSEALRNFDGFYKYLNSLFQTVGTRTSGTNSVNLTALSTASLVLMAASMYLSPYPVTVLMRSSNEGVTKRHKRKSKFHVQSMMLWDFFFFYVPWYVITAIEQYQHGDDSFATFFEIISAYGTVGLSLGAPNSILCFASTWHTTSKLILMCIMLMGRHREMPSRVDTAFYDDADAQTATLPPIVEREFIEEAMRTSVNS